MTADELATLISQYLEDEVSEQTEVQGTSSVAVFSVIGEDGVEYSITVKDVEEATEE